MLNKQILQLLGQDLDLCTIQLQANHCLSFVVEIFAYLKLTKQQTIYNLTTTYKILY